MYLGDFRLGKTFDLKFTTVTTGGVPATLSSSPVISAYPDNSTTQITGGITLTVDFDSVTGLNNVRVVATSGNGYASGSNYDLVITTGTVNGVSVVGYVVGRFSIEARSAVMPTTADRTLDVSSGGEAGVDWANVGSPTTTVTLSGTTVKTATDVETDTADIQTRIPAALTGAGNMKADVLAISGSTTAADNAEVVFDTDFATNYSTSADAWVVRVSSGTGTGQISLSSGLLAWNSAWDAEVQSEVDDALVAQRLDELLNADSDIDGAAPPTVGSVFHELMTKTTGSFTYDQTTDSLEALRDRGDAAWITATGFSTHSASDVWSVATRVLTAATNISGPIADQVWEEAIADHSGTSGSTAESLNAAGGAGDPWNTALPGSYTSGKAGYIVGTYLNATVSSRSSHTAAQAATAVWQDTTSGDFTVTGSIGKSLFTSGAVPGASGGLLIAGSNAATTFATLTVTGAFTVSGGVAFNNSSGTAFSVYSSNGLGMYILSDNNTPLLIEAVADTNTIELVRDDDSTGNILGNITGNLSGSAGSVTGAVGSVTGNVGGNVVGSVASVTGAVGSVTGNVGGNVVGSVASVTTVNDKTGYSLSSSGLDSVSTTAPSGVASNFREMLVQTWRRFFKKTTRDSDEIKTYADNGSTVVTTQTYTASGSDETVNAAS